MGATKQYFGLAINKNGGTKYRRFYLKKLISFWWLVFLRLV